MNNLINIAIKTNNKKILKLVWSMLLLVNSKYRENVWRDKSGNTLMHYVAIKHSDELWEFAKDKPKEINGKNDKGRSPLHCFIENSFVSVKDRKQQEKWTYKNWLKKIIDIIKNKIKLKDSLELIRIVYNKELLIKIINEGGNINQLSDDLEKKELGWNTIDYGSYAKKDNMGSPIELLVYYFWEYFLHEQLKKENFEIIKEYYEYFEILTNLGANINKIYQDKIIDINKPGNVLTHAIDMEDLSEQTNNSSKNAAIFFSRFIDQERDYFALRPFLISSKIDFMETDYNGNTVLHTLFARLSEKKHNFSELCCENIIKDLIGNKNLTKEALLLKNIYKVPAIDLLRHEAKNYRKFFESYILINDLNAELEIKEKNSTEKRKVKKI